MVQGGSDSGTINIVSGGNSTSLHVSSTEDFYNLTKAWAIYTDGLVENTDYSAKYYANQASSSASAASAAKNLILNDSGFIAVAGDLTGSNTIGTVASNITAVQNASANAQTAITKANEASASASNAFVWAEGSDAQVQALGGTHSAKSWVQNISYTIRKWN